MKKLNRNIRVIAENNGDRDGFLIYLDFSGQRELLSVHRHNWILFSMLKDGVSVADIRRWRPEKDICFPGGERLKRNMSVRVCNMVNHLISVIDSYMEDREWAA